MAIVGQRKLLIGRQVVAVELKGHKVVVILEDVTVQVYWGLHLAPAQWVVLGPAFLPIQTWKKRFKPRISSVFHKLFFLTFQFCVQYNSSFLNPQR